MNQPSFYSRVVVWLRKLIGPEPPAPQPPPDFPPSEEAPAPVTCKISLVIYNPTIPGSGGQPLTKVMGWNDPDRLTAELIADLRQISHGYANYQVVERIVLDVFPVKQDGFRYNPDEFVSCMRAGRGFHQPDAVDYDDILRQNNLVEKVQSGAIDEVWTVSFPYAGFYESRMGGPGAFWCNAPPLETANQAGRRFVIMAFNYERGVGEMLESFGHRAESILEQVYRGVPEPDNLWKRFTLHDKIAPGRAEVGNVHFAPNSRRDYDWGNPAPVLSRCRNWLNFPNLSGAPVTVDCREWGGGDIRAHHRWWFNLMPHHIGQHSSSQHVPIRFNWWEYIVDPNRVR
jgi:hypothetical protein